MSARAAIHGLRLFGALIFPLTGTAEAALELDYEADAACPTQAEFVRAVDERAKTSKLDVQAPFESEVSVRLRPDAAGFVGQLEILEDDGTLLRRELRDASCDALARALAFVLVIARQERAESSRVNREVPSSGDERRPAPASGPATKAEATGLRFGFGVEFGVRSAIAPSVSAFEVAEVELRERRRGFPSWTFRAAFARMQASEYGVSDGSVDFQWNAGRWELCPLRLAVVPVLDFTPCLGGHIGAVGASGDPNTPAGQPAEPTLFWLDGFVAARLELWVAKIAALGLRGELSVPLTQYDFAFYEPYSPVFATPSLGTAASIAVRVVFP